MRWWMVCAALTLGCGFFSSDVRGEIPQATVAAKDWSAELTMVSLDGAKFETNQLSNKVVLFVNVASKCGFTGQYDGLQALWEKYRDQGLVIVGAPSNQFGGQEPGSAAEIASFCRMNYGVDFPLLEKQKVKGSDKSALYAYLVGSSLAGGDEVSWNFEKFLVGTDGTVLGRYRSRTAPDDPSLVSDIEAALKTIGGGG